MTTDALISVICITMNHEKYVEQGFRSIVNQTYNNFEILYVDNNSSDSTFEIADEIFKSSGITYRGFKREKSYNLPSNLNFLISQAKGDYLFLISGDDWALETTLTDLTDFYEKNQHFGFVYSNGWYYYEDEKKFAVAETKKFISGRLFDHIFLHGVLFPVGIMVKKETFAKIGLFDESLIVEDYDFWLRVAEKYEIGYFKKPTVFYRKHSESMTGKFGYVNIKDYLQVAAKYKSNKLYRRVTRNLRQFHIYEALIRGEKAKAIKLVVQDFRFERFYFSILLKLLIKKGN